MSNDDFLNIEIEPDEVQDKIDEEIDKVTFDIELLADEERDKAYKLATSMYKKQFFTFLLISIGVVAALFIAFGVLATVTWYSKPERIIILLLSYPSLAAGNLLVLVLVERNIYKKDKWNLARLGITRFSISESRMQYIAAFLPLFLLMTIFFEPSFRFSEYLLLNPGYATWWVLFIISAAPIATFEEIVFRGIYWRYLVMKHGKEGNIMKLFLINSLIFLFIHIPRFFIEYTDGALSGVFYPVLLNILVEMGIVFILSLTLCALRSYFDNLIVPIVFHAIYNVLSFTFSFNINYILLFLAIVFAVLLFTIINQGLGNKTSKKLDLSEKEKIMVSKNILETKQHHYFKMIYYIANSLIIFGTAVLIASVDMIILFVVILAMIPALAIIGYYYMKT
ncbi:MAG: lysostaphin resistance A-like protein [Promethearchaeota archaeon]